MNETVVLERAINKQTGALGSFGFSIMGGATAKLPAVVCSIETGGPAALSKQIQVGDQLLFLNNENLTGLDSKDLVTRIRSAPTPSTFVFFKDEELRERVHHILRKQEEKRRKEKLSSSNSESSIKSSERSPSHLHAFHHSKKGHTHSPSLSSTKELEIETSVNDGQSGEIVKVIGGKIVKSHNNSLSDIPDEQPSPKTHHLEHSNQPLEQRSLKSSCSSGSIGGGGVDDDVSSSSEVTGGGKVFVVKQQRSDMSPALHLNEDTASQNDPLQTLEMTGESKAGVTTIQEEQPDYDPPVSQNSSLSNHSSPSRHKYGAKKSPQVHAKAITLARQLFMLDGFRMSEVAAKLADQSEFGNAVAVEYLKFFEFEQLELDEALRQFLASFTLSGETQEQERVMVHFSNRYFECNPYSYPSKDTVHGITCALLLLNSDLHTDHGGPKMVFSQFVSSLERIGVRLPKDKTKRMFESIKKKALESGQDTQDMSSVEMERSDEGRVYHVQIPGTFVEVELPESACLFKDGYIMRKNIMDAPHKKVPRGKRQWKPYYAYLKGFLLYFVPPNGQLQLTDTSNAIVITHCLAMTAADYHKKSAVIRVTTSDWHVFLLQTNDFADSQQWILAINKASARYSAPPLAAPIGSSAGFQRPTFPLAPTKNTVEEQKEVHELRAKSLAKQLEEHQAEKKMATKNKRSSVWFEKYEFLQFEMNRFHIYLASLHSDTVIDFQGPLPTGLVPSPSISTLATTGVSEELASLADRRRSRDSSSPLPDNIQPRGFRDLSPSPNAFDREQSQLVSTSRKRVETYHR